MEDSILLSIKKMLGLEADYTPFDTDITIFINSTLMVLTQSDIGPKEGFRITGPSETWTEFLTNNVMIESAKEYVYLKVKLVFDPPSNSSVSNMMDSKANELLSRMIIQAESADQFDFMSEDSLIRGGSRINIGLSEETGDGD
jgi:hypothetical protein